MGSIIVFIVGCIGGFFIHALTMKISFKQRTIDNKIKVYDSLIAQWVRMRNFIYAVLPNDPHSVKEFDIMYGESQTFIGEAILVSEDSDLTNGINELNEKMYRTLWGSLDDEQGRNLEKANEIMEEIKKEAVQIIERMRKDIRKSTIFDRADFGHIFGGLFGKEKKN